MSIYRITLVETATRDPKDRNAPLVPDGNFALTLREDCGHNCRRENIGIVSREEAERLLASKSVITDYNSLDLKAKGEPLNLRIVYNPEAHIPPHLFPQGERKQPFSVQIGMGDDWKEVGGASIRQTDTLFYHRHDCIDADIPAWEDIYIKEEENNILHEEHNLARRRENLAHRKARLEDLRAGRIQPDEDEEDDLDSGPSL